MDAEEERMMQQRPVQQVPHWVHVGTGIAIIILAFALAFPDAVSILASR